MDFTTCHYFLFIRTKYVRTKGRFISSPLFSFSMGKGYKVILSLASLGLAVVLLSLTIGKELISGEDPSLGSFAIVNFAGYLFFLLLPVETLVPYYQSLGYSPLVLIIIAVGTAIVAQPVNYAIGYLMSGGITHDLIGQKRYENMTKYLQEYGNVVIFLFNLTPLASSVLSAVAGMLKYRFKDLMLYSLLGLLLKYFLMIVLAKWLFF